MSEEVLNEPRGNPTEISGTTVSPLAGNASTMEHHHRHHDAAAARPTGEYGTSARSGNTATTDGTHDTTTGRATGETSLVNKIKNAVDPPPPTTSANDTTEIVGGYAVDDLPEFRTFGGTGHTGGDPHRHGGRDAVLVSGGGTSYAAKLERHHPHQHPHDDAVETGIGAGTGRTTAGYDSTAINTNSTGAPARHASTGHSKGLEIEGKIESALGSLVSSKSMKAKGLEKVQRVEHEGPLVQEEKAESGAQVHRDHSFGKAHDALGRTAETGGSF